MQIDLEQFSKRISHLLTRKLNACILVISTSRNDGSQIEFISTISELKIQGNCVFLNEHFK